MKSFALSKRSRAVYLLLLCRPQTTNNCVSVTHATDSLRGRIAQPFVAVCPRTTTYPDIPSLTEGIADVSAAASFPPLIFPRANRGLGLRSMTDGLESRLGFDF